MVKTALEVSSQWDDSSVWSAPSIKPLNVEQIIAICKQHQLLVVLEEHSVYGGLGSKVTEITSAYAPTWICRIGIEDRFSQFCGSYSYLMQEHKLDAKSVIQKIKAFVANLPHFNGKV